MIEIERKFLVRNKTYKEVAKTRKRIVQGFLNTDPKRTVRIRIIGAKAFITVKGISNKAGTSRFEWEKEIDVPGAEALLELCEETVIEKTRYGIPYKGFVFEVDEFHGENEGLTVAEIELQDENDIFESPEWLGTEVTGEVKYYNSLLSKQPFKTW